LRRLDDGRVLFMLENSTMGGAPGLLEGKPPLEMDTIGAIIV
jgi:hypothetical protein